MFPFPEGLESLVYIQSDPCQSPVALLTEQVYPSSMVGLPFLSHWGGDRTEPAEWRLHSLLGVHNAVGGAVLVGGSLHRAKLHKGREAGYWPFWAYESQALLCVLGRQATCLGHLEAPTCQTCILELLGVAILQSPLVALGSPLLPSSLSLLMECTHPQGETHLLGCPHIHPTQGPLCQANPCHPRGSKPQGPILDSLQ